MNDETSLRADAAVPTCIEGMRVMSSVKLIFRSYYIYIYVYKQVCEGIFQFGEHLSVKI